MSLETSIAASIALSSSSHALCEAISPPYVHKRQDQDALITSEAHQETLKWVQLAALYR